MPRGRPRKNPAVSSPSLFDKDSEEETSSETTPEETSSDETPIKKSRGRPKGVKGIKKKVSHSESNSFSYSEQQGEVVDKFDDFKAQELDGYTRFYSPLLVKRLARELNVNAGKNPTFFLSAYKSVGVIGIKTTDEINNFFHWYIFDRAETKLLKSLEGKNKCFDFSKNKTSDTNFYNEISIRAYVEDKY